MSIESYNIMGIESSHSNKMVKEEEIQHTSTQKNNRSRRRNSRSSFLFKGIFVVSLFSFTLLKLVSSSPLPSPQSLTEAEFRSFGGNDNKLGEVKIMSGYSRVSRFGRGFANSPSREFRQITVRDPFQFAAGRSLPPLNRISQEVKPVFDIKEMMEEMRIKAAIEEANRKALMKEAEAKAAAEAAESAAKQAAIDAQAAAEKAAADAQAAAAQVAADAQAATQQAEADIEQAAEQAVADIEAVAQEVLSSAEADTTEAAESLQQLVDNAYGAADLSLQVDEAFNEIVQSEAQDDEEEVASPESADEGDHEHESEEEAAAEEPAPEGDTTEESATEYSAYEDEMQIPPEEIDLGSVQEVKKF